MCSYLQIVFYPINLLAEKNRYAKINQTIKINDGVNENGKKEIQWVQKEGF